jgi:hypothetical protein
LPWSKELGKGQTNKKVPDFAASIASQNPKPNAPQFWCENQNLLRQTRPHPLDVCYYCSFVDEP